MRIGILGPMTTGVYWGGVATVIEELAQAFARQGHAVTIITPYYPAYEYECIPVHAISRRRPGFANWSIGGAVRTCRFLRQAAFDVVITNLYNSIFIPFVPPSTCVVHIIHGYKDYSAPSIFGKLKAHAVNTANVFGAKHADVCVANSYLTKNIYKAIFGINSFVVPFGVSAPPPVDVDGPRRREILYVGKLTAVKQVDLIIDAIAVLAARGRHVALRIVGDGPERSSLQEQVFAHNLDDLVSFEGRVSREDLSRFYRTAHCFISLRSAEPFGLTYLEALAHGCPVILPEGSGFCPFVKQGMGIVTRDETPGSVADVIEQAFRIPWRRKWLSDHVTTNFTWSQTASRILELVSGQA